MSIRHIWKVIIALSVVLGIFASVISIWTFSKIGDLRDLIDRAHNWNLKLQITEPSDGHRTSDRVLRVIGYVNFQASATDIGSETKINLLLEENEIDVVCYIHPLSQNEVWYLQHAPIIDQNGRFECLVFLNSNNPDLCVGHQLVALAVPRGQIASGTRHPSLPFYYAPSNVILVKAMNEANFPKRDKNVQK